MLLPSAPPGLEHVERYWDPRARTCAAKLLPGEYYLALHGETLITVVGSAAAVALIDPKRQIAALNHFALPLVETDPLSDPEARAYGELAMMLLVQSILRQGSRTADLRAIIVAGGEMQAPNPEGGVEAAAFARAFLADYGIAIAQHDVGAFCPRKVRHRAGPGDSEIVELTQYNDTIRLREIDYHTQLGTWLETARGRSRPTVADPELVSIGVDSAGVRARLGAIQELATRQPPGWPLAVVSNLDRLRDQLRSQFAAEERNEVFLRALREAGERAPSGLSLREEHQRILDLVMHLRIECDRSGTEPTLALASRVLMAMNILRRHERWEARLLASLGIVREPIAAAPLSSTLLWEPSSAD